MKTTTLVAIASFALVFFSCSKDGEEGDGNNNSVLQGFNSQVCANVQGPSAAYWDFSHSIPLPLTQVPVLKNPGQQFIHSQFPLLGFVMPQGFNANEITDPVTGTIGVNVVRNDNNVVFRWVPNTQVAGQVSATDIIANEINAMFAHYGFNGAPDVVCTTTSNSSFEGIPSQFTARLLRFGGITGQVWVRSTFIAGGTFSAISVTSAPSSEYDTQVAETFLPINYQLFVGRDGTFVDNDNDGVPANEDPDDNNPNVPNNNGG